MSKITIYVDDIISHVLRDSAQNCRNAVRNLETETTKNVEKRC